MIFSGGRIVSYKSPHGVAWAVHTDWNVSNLCSLDAQYLPRPFLRICIPYIPQIPIPSLPGLFARQSQASPQRGAMRRSHVSVDGRVLLLANVRWLGLVQEGYRVDIRVFVEEEGCKEEGDEDGEEGVCVDVELNLHGRQ